MFTPKNYTIEYQESQKSKKKNFIALISYDWITFIAILISMKFWFDMSARFLWA